jgi:hypothetical protein
VDRILGEHHAQRAQQHHEREEERRGMHKGKNWGYKLETSSPLWKGGLGLVDFIGDQNFATSAAGHPAFRPLAKRRTYR